MHKRDLKDYNLITEINNNEGTVALYQQQDCYIIYRYARRGRITNFITNFELIDGDTTTSVKINAEYGQQIIDRLTQGENFSDALIFYRNKKAVDSLPTQHSEHENKFTSTGIKFWRHKPQMLNYRAGRPGTVISTHISPEGACNLKCSYCCVTYRNTHSRIPLEVIQDYVIKLKSRGLRAVILTGGGEPTLYSQFNELVRWLHTQGLSIGLVTNGTKQCWDRVADDVCKMFEWVRVSINVYDNWENNTTLPLHKFDLEKTVIGCSMVYTIENEDSAATHIELMNKVSAVADNIGAKYIRVTPNCLLRQDNLVYQHALLDQLLKQTQDPRFFHQYKTHNTPKSTVCHQSYFRPYLSEEIDKKTQRPGTVYPCDSVMHNQGKQYYSSEYQLCYASDVLDYLDGKIKPEFSPQQNCQGCMHSETVDMLDDWTQGKIDYFDQFPQAITHENFV